MSEYLENLTRRLSGGLGILSDEARRAHAQFVSSQQHPDGGFPGREGDSDLYYTGFALRSLVLLESLDEQVARDAGKYLRGQLAGRATVIDFLSLLYGALLLQLWRGIDIFEDVEGDWRAGVSDTLEKLRREDGGYAKSVEGGSSSTYSTFLVVLCQQLIGVPTPEPERLVELIQSRQREDGGFVEIPQMRRSGTNPNAAAVAVLRIFDALDETTRRDAVDYLLDMQNDEGGLQANTRIDIADTLSTFTGLLTLADVGAADELDLDGVRRFLNSVEVPTGGYRGAAWDPGTDVEYTFYGLGTLALLAELGVPV